MPMLDVDGGTLAYETRGSGSPLVFLHGAWADRHQWAPQVERFADTHQVVTVDLRGHGESTRDDALALAAMADDVVALCDRLDLVDPVVCGLSMGGLVAQHLAVDHPDRVAGVVLADTVKSVPPVPVGDTARRAMAPTTPAKALVRLWGHGTYFRTLLAGVEAAGGPWLALNDDARAYALDCVDTHDAEGFLSVLDAFQTHEAADLAGVSVPALVVHGDHEPAPVRAQARSMARELPDARLEVVPNAGHLSNMDNPDAFGDLLAAFLDERVAAVA